MDFERSRRVQQLIGTLSDSTSSSLDDAKLSEFKSLLKQSEPLVTYAATLLHEHLACNNSQARRLCLELCGVLFSRSRAFRQLLTQQFTTFVELTVGHKSDAPLPGPPASAQALRARALEVIEEWQHTWGEHYPQVTVAYRYLKKQYKFPEIASRAAAAAAEAAARLHRHQQRLLQRYATFKQEFPVQRVQIDSLIQQIQECFKLLAEQPPPPQQQQQQQQQQPQPQEQPQQEQQEQQETGQAEKQAAEAPLHAASANACDDDDTQWEDVAAPVDAAAAAAEFEPAGASAGGDWDADELVGDFPEPEEVEEAADVANRTASLLEQLTDLCRQAALAAQHPLLDWLRLLTQVQPDAQQQQQQQQGGRSQQQQQQWQQERQVLLREVVQLRARLQALIEEATSVWGVSVNQSRRTATAHPSAAAAPADANSSHAAAAAAAAGAGPTAAAAAAAAADVTRGPLNLSSLPSRTVPHTQQQQQQQQQQLAGVSQPQHQLTLGSSLRRLQQQQQQQQHGAVRPVVKDAYAGLRDPTVASGSYTITRDVITRNEQLKFFCSPPDLVDGHSNASGSTAAAAAAAAGGGVGGGGGSKGRMSGEGAFSPEGPQQLSTAAAAAAAAAAAGGRDGNGKATPGRSKATGLKRPAEQSLNSNSNRQGSASEVLKKLVASAPQLPISGDDWLLAEYGVNQHGMELYNHWGAVDSSVGLPKDRLGQLMGYAASYYTPTASQQQKPKAKEPAAAAAGASVAADGNGGPAAAAAGAAGSKPTKAAAPMAQQGAVNDKGVHVQQPAADRGTAPGAAEPVGATSNRRQQQEGKQQQQQQQQQRRLSQREAASAHNRAVLAGTYTDAGIAAALQQQLDQEAAAAAGGGSGKAGRAKKPPERKADKIRRQLLG